MADTKNNTKDQLVNARKSVHVVVLSCPDCGEEIEQVILCPHCGKPMRVIDVKEKFGEEADKYIQEALLKTTKSDQDLESIEEDDEEKPNIILMGDHNLDIDDGGIDPTQDDDSGLDVIFPDDSEPDGEEATPAIEAGDDLSKALDQLDEEEDDGGNIMEDLGLGGEDIPTL